MKLVDIYLESNSLTKVSTSETDGAALLPIVFGDYETEADEAIPVVVVAEDEEGNELRYLVVVERTGSIYEIYGVKEVTFESTEQGITDSVTERSY